ncbi:MAG: excinuclease ABC subunit UvrC [Heliobacteriaceae bacterium]|nr:excinuclease ABC subunit UvrC [Heliobacteriaceae bacterium]MDD4588197.1 excinuclease ABC subunit UvrC [Heliobacteriaceae bacterium]
MENVTLPLAEKLKMLPGKPGVYLMKDKDHRVIYVGKANNLKNRVRSYFQASRHLPAKTQALVARIEDLELIITDSEQEALILECNLIKEYKPRYNIMLRDDKMYPYIKVTVQEAYPRVMLTRRLVKDGAKYFGPYTSAGAVRETLALLRTVFPLRSCSRELNRVRRPCLNQHIAKCLAPCTGKVSQTAYQDMVRNLLAFLEGREKELNDRIRQEMATAAAKLDFERAATLRNQLAALEKIAEKQKIVSPGGGDQDVVGMAREEDLACVQVFFVRGGKVVGREHFVLTGTVGMGDAEVITAFAKQYYTGCDFIPREIFLPVPLEPVSEHGVLTGFLREKRGGSVTIKIPQRGEKHRLVKMVANNAGLVLAQIAKEQSRKQAMTETALRELQQYLQLATLPWRLEGYDISNLFGTEAVGSQVVFEGGIPKRGDYRRFRIRSVVGQDDYASLREVLTRRFARARAEAAALAAGELDPLMAKFAVLPDLVIVDGGKGQVAAAWEVLREQGYGEVAVYGLAKENEWLFRVGATEPVILPRGSQALYLVQRLRDEAHRFAVEYHRQLRAKKQTLSVLDGIPGIGPKRRTALLRHFGSVKKIKEATVQDIAVVEGMNQALARQVWGYLNGEKDRLT